MTKVSLALKTVTDTGADKVLEIHGWHTQCGVCGYGRGGWAGGPAREGKPILTPESRVCHGCKVDFTHTLNVYTGKLVVLAVEKAA